MRIAVARLGKLGERYAAALYRVRGYSIVARNARSQAGEVDLVLRRGATLVIAEVKTRQTRTAGEGHEAEIGRASCRERVEISVVAVSLKKKRRRRKEKIT